MSDLVAPLLAEVLDESDTFWCFVGLMQNTIFISSPRDEDMEKQLVRLSAGLPSALSWLLLSPVPGLGNPACQITLQNHCILGVILGAVMGWELDFDDPCGAVPTQDIPGFYGNTWCVELILGDSRDTYTHPSCEMAAEAEELSSSISLRGQDLSPGRSLAAVPA